MFEITIDQANAFTHPIAKALFCSDEKRFPVKDACAIVKLVDQIRIHLKSYNKTVEKTIKDNGGVKSSNGSVNYKTANDRKAAEEIISGLNSTKIELTGNRIKPTNDWPKLTLAEVAVLSPILDY